MKTIEKTLDILEVFLKQKGEIGIVELGNLSGFNISAVHRIASTLVRRGYLSQQRKGEKYSLSPKLLQFSSVIRERMKIGDVALPYLLKLNKLVDETVNLAVLDDNGAVFIEVVESSHYLRTFPQLGAKEPLHCTGVGKVFLAHLRDEELERFLNSKGLPDYTENTITDVSKLKQELSIIKREGTAIDNEEFEPGVKCVASPIKDANGNVGAAVSISAPSARLHSERVEELKPLVKSCALEISQAMGYVGERSSLPASR